MSDMGIDMGIYFLNMKNVHKHFKHSAWNMFLVNSVFSVHVCITVHVFSEPSEGHQVFLPFSLQMDPLRYGHEASY